MNYVLYYSGPLFAVTTTPEIDSDTEEQNANVRKNRSKMQMDKHDKRMDKIELKRQKKANKLVGKIKKNDQKRQRIRNAGKRAKGKELKDQKKNRKILAKQKKKRDNVRDVDDYGATDEEEETEGVQGTDASELTMGMCLLCFHSSKYLTMYPIDCDCRVYNQDSEWVQGQIFRTTVFSEAKRQMFDINKIKQPW